MEEYMMLVVGPYCSKDGDEGRRWTAAQTDHHGIIQLLPSQRQLLVEAVEP